MNATPAMRPRPLAALAVSTLGAVLIHAIGKQDAMGIPTGVLSGVLFLATWALVYALILPNAPRGESAGVWQSIHQRMKLVGVSFGLVALETFVLWGLRLVLHANANG